MNKFIAFMLASCFAMSVFADSQTTTKTTEKVGAVVEDTLNHKLEEETIDPVTGEKVTTTKEVKTEVKPVK